MPISPKTAHLWTKWVRRATDRIFTIDGFPLTLDYFRKKMFYPMLEELGIPKKSPHKCRFTCATLLARANVLPLVIQRILGHSDYAFTANTYTADHLQDLANGIAQI